MSLLRNCDPVASPRDGCCSWRFMCISYRFQYISAIASSPFWPSINKSATTWPGMGWSGLSVSARWVWNDLTCRTETDCVKHRSHNHHQTDCSVYIHEIYWHHWMVMNSHDKKDKDLPKTYIKKDCLNVKEIYSPTDQWQILFKFE